MTGTSVSWALQTRLSAIATILFAGVALQTDGWAADWIYTTNNSGCTQPANTELVECGNHGKFYFGAAGSSITVPASCTGQFSASGGGPIVAGEVLAPIEDTGAPTPPAPNKQGKANGACALGKVAIIDWDSRHGDIVSWIAGTVFGDTNATSFFPILPTGSSLLGTTVNDRHVVARLCNVLQLVDGPMHCAAPKVINLSLGRMAITADSPNAQSCDSTTLPCQVAKIVKYLYTRQITTVAAAGHNRVQLFPASVPEVLSVAGLDFGEFRSTGNNIALLDSPSGTPDALAPANQLCPNGWSVAGGTSYASAAMSGALAKLKDSGALTVEPATIPGWGIARNAANGDFRLVNSSNAQYPPNAGLRALYEPLWNFNGSCWSGGGTAHADATENTTATGYLYRNSIDVNNAATIRPAPISDACIPCGGLRNNPASSYLRIDMNQAGALNINQLTSLQIRVGSTYTTIASLSTHGPLLQSIRAGGVDFVDIPNGMTIIGTGPQQPYLVYNYKNLSNANESSEKAILVQP